MICRDKKEKKNSAGIWLFRSVLSYRCYAHKVSASSSVWQQVLKKKKKNKKREKVERGGCSCLASRSRGGLRDVTLTSQLNDLRNPRFAGHPFQCRRLACTWLGSVRTISHLGTQSDCDFLSVNMARARIWVVCVAAFSYPRKAYVDPGFLVRCL